MKAKAEKLTGPKAWEWSTLKCTQGSSRRAYLSSANKHVISLPKCGGLKS